MGKNIVNAPAGLVLLFEAIMILMTPHHRFRSPTEATPMVTWPAARKMLSDARSLVRRFIGVDIGKIPLENLGVLQDYKSHKNWLRIETIPDDEYSTVTRYLL